MTLVTAVMKAREGSVRAEARLLQRTGHDGSGMQDTAGRELGTQTGWAGSSGHGWEGENVKWHVGQPPPLFL